MTIMGPPPKFHGTRDNLSDGPSAVDSSPDASPCPGLLTASVSGQAGRSRCGVRAWALFVRVPGWSSALAADWLAVWLAAEVPRVRGWCVGAGAEDPGFPAGDGLHPTALHVGQAGTRAGV
jgi:hypothetical protein